MTDRHLEENLKGYSNKYCYTTIMYRNCTNNVMKVIVDERWLSKGNEDSSDELYIIFNIYGT